MGWYGATPQSDGPPIENIGALESLIDVETDDDRSWHTDAERDFSDRVKEVGHSRIDKIEARRRCQKETFRARISRCVIKAALVQLCRGRAEGLFGDGQFPASFSSKTVRDLGGIGFPWTAALSLAYSEEMVPGTDDPYLREIERQSPDQLKRRFKDLETELRKLLEQWRELPGGNYK